MFFRARSEPQIRFRLAADFLASESELQQLIRSFDSLQLDRLVYFRPYDTSSSNVNQSEVAMFDEIMGQLLVVPPPPSASPQPSGPFTPSTSSDSLPTLASLDPLPEFPDLLHLSTTPSEDPANHSRSPEPDHTTQTTLQAHTSRSRSASPFFDHLPSIPDDLLNLFTSFSNVTSPQHTNV